MKSRGSLLDGFMISVIVPVYNGEKWLPRCLDSIVAQTIFLELEIILVNDGSTDGSGKLIEAYSKEYANIIGIHVENGGVSRARNIGIERSTGEYLSFVDVDDYLDPSFYEVLSCRLDDTTDIVAGGFIAEYEDGQIIRPRISQYLNGSATMEEFFAANPLDPNIWNKLYKRAVLGDIRFNQDLRIGEDKLFLFQYLLNSNGCYIEESSMYHYYINPMSVMRAAFSEKKLLDALYIAECIARETKEKYPEFDDLAYSALIDTKCRMLAEMCASDMNLTHRDLYTKLKRDISQFGILKKWKNSSKKHFIGFLLVRLSPELYVFLKHKMKLQYK